MKSVLWEKEVPQSTLKGEKDNASGSTRA